MPIPREEVERMKAEEEKKIGEIKTRILCLLESQPEMLFSKEEIMAKLEGVEEKLVWDALCSLHLGGQIRMVFLIGEDRAYYGIRQ